RRVGRSGLFVPEDFRGASNCKTETNRQKSLHADRVSSIRLLALRQGESLEVAPMKQAFLPARTACLGLEYAIVCNTTDASGQADVVDQTSFTEEHRQQEHRGRSSHFNWLQRPGIDNLDVIDARQRGLIDHISHKGDDIPGRYFAGIRRSLERFV